MEVFPEVGLASVLTKRDHRGLQGSMQFHGVVSWRLTSRSPYPSPSYDECDERWEELIEAPAVTNRVVGVMTSAGAVALGTDAQP